MGQTVSPHTALKYTYNAVFLEIHCLAIDNLRGAREATNASPTPICVLPINSFFWGGYTLRAGRSGDRIPARYSAPVQTSPGTQPASYTMGTGSFSGVKQPGRGIVHPPPYSAEVKERVELYLFSPSGPWWPVIGRTSLYFTELKRGK